MGISDEIIEARKRKGLSQNDLAIKIAEYLGSNYSARQYQNIEAGKFPVYKREIMEAVGLLSKRSP